jgi:hypothetical protein
MLGHQFEEPTPLRDLVPETPPRLVSIVQRLMRKQPEERYGSTDEVIRELQVITSGGRGSQAPSPGPMSRLDVESSEPTPNREDAFEVVSRGRKSPIKATPRIVRETHEAEASRPTSAEPNALGLWLTLVGIASGVASGVLVWLINRG